MNKIRVARGEAEGELVSKFGRARRLIEAHIRIFRGYPQTGLMFPTSWNGGKLSESPLLFIAPTFHQIHTLKRLQIQNLMHRSSCLTQKFLILSDHRDDEILQPKGQQVMQQKWAIELIGHEGTKPVFLSNGAFIGADTSLLRMPT